MKVFKKKFESCEINLFFQNSKIGIKQNNLFLGKINKLLVGYCFQL